MSKHRRITDREHIRRNRQSNAARFERWCTRNGSDPKHPASLIAYRLLGGKRYRSSGGGRKRG